MNQDNLTVFHALLLKCIKDLHQAATILQSRIRNDQGTGLKLSAATLAQEAQKAGQHVECIRYTKEFFNPHTASPERVRLCKRYTEVQKLFQTDVVNRLAAIADPDEADAGGIWNGVKSFLERSAPKEAADIAERQVGSIENAAPGLIDVLEKIRTETSKLEDEVERCPGTNPNA